MGFQEPMTRIGKGVTVISRSFHPSQQLITVDGISACRDTNLGRNSEDQAVLFQTAMEGKHNF